MNKIKFMIITIFLLIAVPTITLATSYVGNLNSYKFHYQGCRMEKKMKQTNRIYFESRQEAVNRGMTPCGICIP